MIDSGGTAPNVVQAKATVRYLIRARDLTQLHALLKRVEKIAEGAALMCAARSSAAMPISSATPRSSS
jgi:aminobenzoyl-glutamate utilization protein B